MLAMSKWSTLPDSTVASFKESVGANPNLPILTVWGTSLVVLPESSLFHAVAPCLMVLHMVPAVSAS